MLRLENVSLSYGERKILESFDLSLEENVSTCILGPSGLGKTTLLGAASGILKPEKGTVERPTGGKSSFVFQDDRLLPWFTAIENITALGVEKKRAEEFLEKVGLEKEGEKFPAELSGGMRRRLAIARAFAFGGDTFFLDEPIGGLDVKTAAEMLSLIKSEILGKTAVIVTHSPAEAFALGERILIVGKSPLAILADLKNTDFKSENELKEYIEKII